MNNWIAVAVAVWWIANIIATIASKNVMLEAFPTNVDKLTGWTPAFRDLRWLDLTMMQHLIGATVASVWITAVQGNRIFPNPTTTSYKYIMIASIANAVGNLATNASFAAVSSSVTQVIKSCEPIFTMTLAFLLYKKGDIFGCSTLVSVTAMVAGACMFISGDASYNIWGLGAAIVSNMSFPLRNIYLKKVGETWKGQSLQKFAVMSACSFLILSPFVGIKCIVTIALPSVQPRDSLISAVFHFVYNAASITVLQSYSLVVHALLNLIKRVFVIISNMIFFSTPLSARLLFGLVIFLTGLVMFQYARNSKLGLIRKPKWLSFGLLIIITTCIGLTGWFNQAAYIHSLYSYQKLGSQKYYTARFTTAWVYDTAIQVNVLENIAGLQRRNPGSDIVVYCGTSQCMSAVKSLEKPNISAKFLVVSDLVQDTPLEDWLARHPIHKILTGKQFEDHLHEAVRLALLWHQGGIYFDPLVKFKGFTPPLYERAWVSIGPNATQKSTGGILGVAQFPARHAFIGNLTRIFALEYAQNIDRANATWPVQFDFQRILHKRYTAMCVKSSSEYCPEGFVLSLDEKLMPLLSTQIWHFGTLSYDKRVRRKGRANLGDEMQSFPGVQFLPFVDHFLERENLDESKGSGLVLAFLNAWWAGRGFNWPPPKNIEPIMLSMHIVDSAREKFLKHADYLQSRAPIGCRDTHTLEVLSTKSIDAFFSGCLTLLIKNPNVGKERTGKIFLVDVRKQYRDLLPEEINKTAIISYQDMSGSERFKLIPRFQAAYSKLEMYSKARVVVTQRIHTALPCVALGIPVIFINSPSLPGGGGSSKASSPRVMGLTPLFHTLNALNTSKEGMGKWLRDFDWVNPPPNPGVGLLMQLRASNWNVIRRNQVLYDSARKFGMLPLSTPVTNSHNQLLFHMIIQTSANNSSSPIIRGLNRPTWRSIESILHHHHLAKIIIHSNDVDQSHMKVLTEVGYTIEVQSLTLPKSEANNLPKSGITQTDLDRIKLEILFESGGVYVDTNVILVRPIDQSMRNVLVWGDDERNHKGVSFMKFDKRHPFVAAALKESNSHPKTKGLNGTQSLLAMWRNWQGGASSSSVQSITQTSSVKDMYFGEDNLHECIESTSGKKYEENMESIKKKVLLVQVMGMEKRNEKLKSGTICKHLFNSFCVLCNDIY